MRYVLLITLFALGCGQAHHKAGGEASPPALRDPAIGQADIGDATASMALAEQVGKSLPTEATIERKIVYTADVDLVVEDFEATPDKVETLARQFDAYVASSAVTGSPGSPRRGEWKIRVPVEHFEAFLAAARELGEIQSVSVDSQDVTEEFYDVEARIRNKKAEEARLLKLLEDATGELEDILAVERELSRVREEIERVEGRLRVLKDLTSLTTVTLTVREIKDYVPAEGASYTTRVRRGFEASIAALVSTAQGLSIVVIVLLPWLGVLLVLGITPLVVWRIARRRRTS
jgi:hypothetical protein